MEVYISFNIFIYIQILKLINWFSFLLMYGSACCPVWFWMVSRNDIFICLSIFLSLFYIISNNTRKNWQMSQILSKIWSTLILYVFNNRHIMSNFCTSTYKKCNISPCTTSQNGRYWNIIRFKLNIDLSLARCRLNRFYMNTTPFVLLLVV